MPEEAMQGISFNPDTYVSGGILDNVNATLLTLRAKQYTYPNSSTTVVAVIGDMLGDDGATHEQVWSIGGSVNDWEIINDGKGVKNVSGKTGMTNNSNLALMIQELILNCGFPKQKVGGDLSVFDGLHAHWIQKPVPGDRSNMQGQKKDGDRPKTFLVADKIHRFPWDTKAKGTAGRPAASPTPAPTASAPAASPAQSQSGGAALTAAKANNEALEIARESLLPTVQAACAWHEAFGGDGSTTEGAGKLSTAKLAGNRHAKVAADKTGALKAQVLALLGDAEWVTAFADETAQALEAAVEFSVVKSDLVAKAL